MKHLILAALLLAAPQKNEQPEVLLQRAIQAEMVDGNLPSAIEQYKKIVARNGASRTVLARALVQLAGCYDKQGNAEARKTYERVVREFADQAESAAAARTRLASMRKAPAGGNDISFRRVSDASQFQVPAVSYDGRYISYQFGRGSIMVRELATGKDYTLAVPSPGSRDYAEATAISRDSKMVAYAWEIFEGNSELRTIPLQTSSPGQPRRLFRSGDSDVYPFDWSPDGTRIAVKLIREDGTRQMGLVSTADGSLKVLKSVDWPGPTKISFSPDGKYLAYDWAADNNSEQRDVFVMAVDGSREIAAVAHPSHNSLAGWSPDGKHLLFFSDRTGSSGLWSQAVVDGRPQGAAALIKADLGSARPLGITASGALYLSSRVEGSDIEVVSVDFATGQMVGSPVKPITEYVGANSQPEWSRDGKFMSYVSRREGRWVLATRELGTGKVRVIRPQLSSISSKAWSPDGKFFAVTGRDLKGRRWGLFLVDAETGEASPLAEPGVNNISPAWSPDGKKLYYRGSVDQQRAFFERDMVSGAVREIIRRPNLGNVNLSPDGRWIATRTVDAAGKFAAAILFPASGGEVRELMRVNQPVFLGVALWAPDSNSFIVGKRYGEKVLEFWQVPISGGEPRKLDLKIENASQFSLHPDGRQVAYTTGQRKEEVWVLENFLPASTASKGRLP